MWKNGPVNAAAVTIPALFKTSRLFIVSSVGLLLQNPRVRGAEEKLDRLTFLRNSRAAIVLDLDRDDEILRHLHAVAREVGDVQALPHFAADPLFVRGPPGQ